MFGNLPYTRVPSQGLHPEHRKGAGVRSRSPRHSGPDSAVIFDYSYNEIMHDARSSKVKMLRCVAQVTGEQFPFGIDQGQTEPFLSQGDSAMFATRRPRISNGCILLARAHHRLPVSHRYQRRLCFGVFEDS